MTYHNCKLYSFPSSLIRTTRIVVPNTRQYYDSCSSKSPFESNYTCLNANSMIPTTGPRSHQHLRITYDHTRGSIAPQRQCFRTDFHSSHAILRHGSPPSHSHHPAKDNLSSYRLDFYHHSPVLSQCRSNTRQYYDFRLSKSNSEPNQTRVNANSFIPTMGLFTPAFQNLLRSQPYSFRADSSAQSIPLLGPSFRKRLLPYHPIAHKASSRNGSPPFFSTVMFMLDFKYSLINITLTYIVFSFLFIGNERLLQPGVKWYLPFVTL